MESRVPVPTDNIYKFYALFGLLLFIFSAGASIYVTENSNKQIMEILKENVLLEQSIQANASLESYKMILDKRLEVIISNRKAFIWCLAAFVVLSVFLMIYGFKKWHTEVQPRLDKLLDLRINLTESQSKQDIK